MKKKKKMDWFRRNKYRKPIVFFIVVSILLLVVGYVWWMIYDSKLEEFKNNERILEEAVREYYEYRPELLPKSGETREVKLEKLFQEERIESIYIPGTKNICDTDSWVRVRNNEGTYEYYTYLKCGKYESQIDHNGPEITLKGESTITLHINSTYEELGVESVFDDTDGKMNVEDVVIDTTKLNTKKIGNYEVTYKIRDSFHNQTTVKRTVIIAQNFTSLVQESTDESNYYKGKEENNYLLFSGMLFRIINANEDGTVSLLSADGVTNLRYDTATYQGSNVETYLNEVFYKAIHKADEYLVESEYCVGTVTNQTDTASACNEKVTAKVGVLSLDKYLNTVEDGFSGISYGNSIGYLLANKVGNANLVILPETGVNQLEASMLPPIKPVITLKAGLFITDGDGTAENPYKLDDYTYAKTHDAINTRLIGEYISYSGSLFRIIGKDKNNNVKVIMAHPIYNNTTNEPVKVTVSDINNYQYNITDTKNPGYLLNEEYIDYLNDTSIVKGKFNIITNESLKKYQEYEKEEISAKLVLASTLDLFSTTNNNEKSKNNVQLRSDKTTGQDKVIMSNALNGLVLDTEKQSFYYFALKPVTYLDGNLTIKSGKGTEENPYILR